MVFIGHIRPSDLFIPSLNVSRVVCAITVFVVLFPCTHFRCDDATYTGSHSGTATAGATKSYRPTDVIERLNGDRRCGENVLVGLQSLLTKYVRSCLTSKQNVDFFAGLSV